MSTYARRRRIAKRRRAARRAAAERLQRATNPYWVARAEKFAEQNDAEFQAMMNRVFDQCTTQATNLREAQ